MYQSDEAHLGKSAGGDRAPLVAWTAVTLAWLVITWVWSGLHLAMTVDDTFYYFKTALNLARGLGSTFDGINRTNGYHPLWLATLALVAKVFNEDVVVFTRVAFTVQLAFIWAGGYLLTRLPLAGGTRVLWPLALALANPFIAKILLCGQETALQFFLSSALLVGWWKVRATAPAGDTKAWALLGVGATLVTLARLDGLFFCGIVLAMPVLAPSEKEEAAGFSRRLRSSLVGGAVFAVTLAPYLAFNKLSFGHLMPVSGAIKARLSADELAPLGARAAAIIVALAALAITAQRARRKGAGIWALLAPPLGACAVLAIYNFGVRGEMSPALIRIWYLEPYLLAFALVMGALGMIKLPALATWGVRGAAALWLAGALFSWKYRLEPRSYSVYQAAEQCSRWFDRHGSPTAVAAAWDAGFTAAFTRKPVMNLDGLISSWDFKEGFLDTGKVDAFVLDEHPVDYVLQYMWPSGLRKVATRFRDRPLPRTPERQTSTSGSRDPEALSERWGVDLASFTVAHYECFMVSVATNPRATVGPVYYFALGRAPVPGRPSLAEFALANFERTSCQPPDSL